MRFFSFQVRVLLPFSGVPLTAVNVNHVNVCKLANPIKVWVVVWPIPRTEWHISMSNFFSQQVIATKATNDLIDTSKPSNHLSSTLDLQYLFQTFSACDPFINHRGCKSKPDTTLWHKKIIQQITHSRWVVQCFKLLWKYRNCSTVEQWVTLVHSIYSLNGERNKYLICSQAWLMNHMSCPWNGSYSYFSCSTWRIFWRRRWRI